MTYRYQHSCIESTYEDIQSLMSQEQSISLATFRSKIGPEQWAWIQRHLGYDRSFPISKDWHVGYYRSVYRGKPAYFLRHSRIEYIFTEEPRENPSSPERYGADLSREAAEALARFINTGLSKPLARVWMPPREGMAPRVYVGSAGFVTLSRTDVHGHRKSGSARLTLPMTELYPAQRVAFQRGLEAYRAWTSARIEAESSRLLAEPAGDHAQHERAVLEAVDAGAATYGEIIRATGLGFQATMAAIRRLKERGEWAS